MTLGTEAIQAHLDNLTKPPGSLGKLEDLAMQLCQIQQTLKPKTHPRTLVLFAGDHGVIVEKVSYWPSEVTVQMIENIVSGGAASSIFAKTTKTGLRLVDVGSLGKPLPESERYRYAAVSRGTRNLAKEPAMTKEQFDQAFTIGQEEANRACDQGVRVLATGEMGIGNTTPASCITLALVPDISPEQAVGPGAGADANIIERKRRIVKEAVERIQPYLSIDPITALAEISGFEIVAMAGFYSQAARRKRTIVLDGFITTAAALIAEKLFPGTTQYMIAGHCSAEPGHQYALKYLGLDPLLQCGMRLGEGTGALAAMPLLDLAAAMVSDMRTFDDLGIIRG